MNPIAVPAISAPAFWALLVLAAMVGTYSILTAGPFIRLRVRIRVPRRANLWAYVDEDEPRNAVQSRRALCGDCGPTVITAAGACQSCGSTFWEPLKLSWQDIVKANRDAAKVAPEAPLGVEK